MIVRKAIEKSLAPHNYPPRKQTHLWVSAVGGCPRSAIFSLLGYEKETEFPLSLREKFRFGSVLEDDTGKALREAYKEELTNQVVLKTKIWSGKCDWGLRVGKQDPILIEHKATGSKYWRKYGTPPSESHVAQLILYGQLYEELYNARPKLILYYRAWSNFAELKLRDLGDRVKITGVMDGKPYEDELMVNVSERRVYLEKFFDLRELPPYVKVDACYFRGKPSCPFFNQCRKLSKKKSKPQSVAGWGLF